MDPAQEKRTCERRCYNVPIAVAYFNQAPNFEAQILNHSAEGMCFKSSCALQPGTVVYIRVKKVHPDGECTGAYEGLRIVALARVKWCEDKRDSPLLPYRIGIKYLQEAY